MICTVRNIVAIIDVHLILAPNVMQTPITNWSEDMEMEIIYDSGSNTSNFKQCRNLSHKMFEPTGSTMDSYPGMRHSNPTIRRDTKTNILRSVVFLSFLIRIDSFFLICEIRFCCMAVMTGLMPVCMIIMKETGGIPSPYIYFPSASSILIKPKMA